MTMIFSKENIFFPTESLENKQDLFKQIAHQAWELGYVEAEQACFEGLKEREEQQTTGFQEGFAIPHCKDQTVKSPKLLFFKTNPIPWDSLDGSDITNSFILLIPEQSAKEHLKYLSLIARSLIDTTFRQELKAATTSEMIYQLITEKLGV